MSGRCRGLVPSSDLVSRRVKDACLIHVIMTDADALAMTATAAAMRNSPGSSISRFQDNQDKITSSPVETLRSAGRSMIVII
jgi:hypothetical protein